MQLQRWTEQKQLPGESFRGIESLGAFGANRQPGQDLRALRRRGTCPRRRHFFRGYSAGRRTQSRTGNCGGTPVQSACAEFLISGSSAPKPRFLRAKQTANSRKRADGLSKAREKQAQMRASPSHCFFATPSPTI